MDSYQMCLDDLERIAVALGMNTSKFMTHSPQHVAEMIIQQAKDTVTDAHKLAEAVQSQISFLKILERHPAMRADAAKLRGEVEDWLKLYGEKYLEQPKEN